MKEHIKKIMLMIAITILVFPFISVQATEEFTLKWISPATGCDERDVPPLAVDVNDDGYRDIIVTGRYLNHGRVACVDGNTGAILWTFSPARGSISGHSPPEAYDLDNDGDLEIVVAGYNVVVALNANNGSIYWINNNAKGNEEYQMVLDTDGNNLPYVYVCSPDSSIYNRGRLRKMDGRTGTVLQEIVVWYPCHGGLSAGDITGDGEPELVMTDRAVWYDYPNNTRAKGVQAYNPITLELLWCRPDILCSSHCAILTDITNDGILDVVVSQQRAPNPTHAGIYCLYGTNGSNITGHCVDNISGLRSHENMPVYDVDGDGHLELATCAYSPVQIVDLTTMQIKAVLATDGKPPYYANVLGDSNLEIILSEEVSTIRIYSNSYQLLYSIPSANSRSSIVQDIDNDGLNELIFVSGTDGVIKCYDTPGQAPYPLPRTNTSNYNERRTRTAIYIAPPIGNQTHEPEEVELNLDVISDSLRQAIILEFIRQFGDADYSLLKITAMRNN